MAIDFLEYATRLVRQRPACAAERWPMMRAANVACDLARVLHQVDRLDREQPHQAWDACLSEDRVRYLTLAEYVLKLLVPLVRKSDLPALDALTEQEETP